MATDEPTNADPDPQPDTGDAADPKEARRVARRQLLRVAAWTVPAIVGSFIVTRAAEAQASCLPSVSCRPEICGPLFSCRPDICRPTICRPTIPCLPIFQTP